MTTPITNLSKYLLGTRDALLGTADAAAAPLEISRVVLLRRAAEVLTHLAFRQDALPALQEALRPELRSLLLQVLAEMRALAIECNTLPGGCVAAAYEQVASDYGAILYASLATMLCQCLAAMSVHQPRSARSDALLARTIQASRAIETRLAEGSQRAIGELCEHELAVGAQERLPTPTAQELADYLRRRFPSAQHLQVGNVQRKDGVNTKAIFSLQIEGIPGWPRDVIMRQDRRFKVIDSVVADEFDLMSMLHRCGIPVAKPLLAEQDGTVLRGPFILLERLRGDAGNPATVGEHAHSLASQMAVQLARLHSLSVSEAGMPRPRQTTTRARVLDMIEHHYERWVRSRFEPSLIVESAFAWLRANVDIVDDCSVLVHGDYDLRNLLVERGTVVGMLDWELAHIGHPAEDLAYCRTDVSGMMDWREFIALYEASGGPRIDPKVIDYFYVWAYVFRNTATLVAAGGYISDQHRELLLGACAFIDYVQCRGLLAELLKSHDSAAVRA